MSGPRCAPAGARSAPVRLGRAGRVGGPRAGARGRASGGGGSSARSWRAAMRSARPGIALRNVAGGWRLTTHPDAAPVVEQYVLASRHTRLTKAALETLSIVAYKQPVTRHQISGDPRRELRRRAPRPRRPRARRRGRARGGTGAPDAVRHDARVPRAPRACRRSRRSRRSRPCSDSPRPRATTSSGSPTWTRPRRPASSRRGRRAGPARARPCRVRFPPRVRGADRRRPGHRERRGRPRSATAWIPPPTRSGSTAAGSRVDPGLRYLALHKPRGRHDHDARSTTPSAT